MSRASGAPTPQDRQAVLQLRRHDFRCTPGRIATLQVLMAGGPGHLSLAEIHHRVAELGWPTDHTAVRRTLHAFARCGLTHALAAPGPVAYGLATPPHHHVVCDICGALTDVPAATLAATLTAAQAATGYALIPAGVTLPGRCPVPVGVDWRRPSPREEMVAFRDCDVAVGSASGRQMGDQE